MAMSVYNILLVVVAILPIAAFGQEKPLDDNVQDTPVPYGAQCTAHGDIHYDTFDNAHLHYQGVCKHLLVGVCCRETKLPPFNVYLKGERRYGLTSLSWVSYVEIEYSGHVLWLTRQGSPHGTTVSGSYDSSVATLTTHGLHGYSFTTPELRVIFDGMYSVYVTLDRKYMNQTCGMCGNYNSIEEDDYRTRLGAYVVPGTWWSWVYDNTIGSSWVVPDSEDPSQRCLRSRLRRQTLAENCDKETMLRWQKICRSVVSEFARCLDDKLSENIYEDCVFDGCHSNQDSIVDGYRQHMKNVVNIKNPRCLEG